ncbi:hypothetical protein [Parasphingorhabdus sp.]|uniref:hypothetical protein n=1 Tax=Parasphingorhabdus sp. TaxID=2709688 RepID=UPI0032645CD4
MTPEVNAERIASIPPIWMAALLGASVPELSWQAAQCFLYNISPGIPNFAVDVAAVSAPFSSDFEQAESRIAVMTDASRIVTDFGMIAPSTPLIIADFRSTYTVAVIIFLLTISTITTQVDKSTAIVWTKEMLCLFGSWEPF